LWRNPVFLEILFRWEVPCANSFLQIPLGSCVANHGFGSRLFGTWS
jgi:hypothetical protein